MAIETTAPATLQVPGTAPRFLIGSHVWYGLVPRLNGVRPAPGVADVAVDGWGGQLRNDEDVAHALLTLDPVLLLLNLAGYQVPEVVLGVPEAPAETAAADLVSVDMRSMEIARGTTRALPVPGTTPASAHVSLWVEPRYRGANLSLTALVEPMAEESIDLAFAASGTGWLRLRWPAELSGPEWAADLAGLADVLAEALVAELEFQRSEAIAASDPDSAVLCGLLSLYDHRTWRVPIPHEAPFDRITPGVTLFGERLAEVVDATGLGEFLRGEISQAAAGPPSVLGRWPAGTEAEDRRAAVENLTWCTDELVAQCIDRAAAGDEAAAELAGTAYGDVEALTVTAALLRWQELGVLDFLGSIETAVGAEVYGGWDLRRGDDDATNRYDGAVRTERLPLPVERGFVAQLRADLAVLGFGPMFRYEADEDIFQTFDVWLERAVRELQLYGRMPNLAEETTNPGPYLFYGDRLSSVPNPLPYTGPVCGVANAETRALIQYWIGARLRCPIVVEARSSAGGYTRPWSFPAGDAHANDAWRVTDNLWRADQVQRQAPRMYARDFTGHWTLTPENVAAGRDLGQFVLGAWSNAMATGPWSDPPGHVWAESEVTTDRLVARAAAALSPEERSTFRVVRAVAEVECIGYFDCFNAYDPGFISAGPYHWTLGLALGGSTVTADAELPPFLAYLKGLGGPAAAAYEAAFGIFGCAIDTRWPAGTSGDRSPCWESGHRKYTAWVTFEDEHGAFVEAERDDHEGAEWFRQWHWYCRFALNSRTIQQFRTRQWDYARLRLRDVLAAPWDPAIQMTDPNAPGGTRPATIGDLFTSERAVGIMARWHVNRPANLLPLRAASKLRKAYVDAGAANWGDPAAWTDQNEETLCDALYNLRPPDPPGDAKDWLRESLQDVYEWPASWGNNGRAWQLPLDPLRNYPRLAGLGNGRTDVDTPYARVFTVDLRDPIGARRTPTARSSNQQIVADAGIAVTGAAPNHTITVTPVAGATGTVTVTVTADNGAEAASAAFFLTVGGAVEANAPPPPPTPVLALSIRRHSYRADTAGLP